MPDKHIDGEVFRRVMTLDRFKANDEQRTIPAALSSELPVTRWFGEEILVHEQESVDLSRASDGLPMLFNHNSDMPIGVIRDVSLDPMDKKLRGILHFSNNAKATEIWSDVRDGFLKDISIGYQIKKWQEEEKTNVVRVTRWQLNEASVVTVPADHTVGINRKQETVKMTDNTESGSEAVQNDVIDVNEFKITRERNLKEGTEKGRKEERKRISEIRQMFGPFLDRGKAYEDLMNTCVDRGTNVPSANKALMGLLAGDFEPLAGDYLQTETEGSLDRKSLADVAPARAKRGEVVSGSTDMEKFLTGAEEVLLIKCGINRDKEKEKTARQSEFWSIPLSELPREYLRRAGDQVRGEKLAIVGKALTRDGIISHGSSDFANLLANVANKSLQIGWEEAPETWNAWCRTGSIPDFRQATRPNLSTFGDLQVVYENGEYTYGTFSDLKEVLTLATYGKLFSISRQAIINDDLNALSRIPMNMGRAAARKIGDLAYAVLTTGTSATLHQDSTALFHSNHANYVTSGAAPSVTTIETARTAMGTQTDPAGNTLNIRPAYLIVPLALESTAKVLAAAEYNPAGTAGTLTPNTVRGTFEVVADPRLDAYNAAGWFMAASPSMHETVEVAFLDGNQSPYMEQKEGWSQDGTEFKVRIDAVAAPLDFRGLYYNDGA